MTARLDHVGIAVSDVHAALAFYRDALGLEVHAPEEVASQHVRAWFIPVGEATLELLESTASGSAIDRFLQKRGPGLHHVTLRVPDLRTALARLVERGIRLIDIEPRPGAEGALVAFIHPSASHGVLVELKQAASSGPTLRVGQVPLGELTLTTLNDGPLRLDGGAMFGVVPRTLWAQRAPPDDRNRILLAMRPLLVEGPWGRLLIDCGAGDKMTPELTDRYGLGGPGALDRSLAEVGLTPGSIDVVLATHLHFDHVGGATTRVEGTVRPRFPRASYAIRAAEWEDATHPHERNRASYLPDDFLPLAEAGVVAFYEGDRTIRPGVRVVRTGGHTGQHQVVYLESSGKTAVFAADLVPTVAHLQDAWVTGYDLFPMDTLAFKRAFLREAIEREYLVFFEHDPHVAAGYVREKGGKRYVEPVL